jgi:hypothetical protein
MVAPDHQMLHGTAIDLLNPSEAVRSSRAGGSGDWPHEQHVREFYAPTEPSSHSHAMELMK